MNQNETPHSQFGRPRKFSSPEEIQKKIDDFFLDCEKRGKPITITGLALALDTTRETLMDYEYSRGDDFSDAVKKAKLKVQRYAEEQLFEKGGSGPIFALKNHGWRDHASLEHRGQISIKESDREIIDRFLKQTKEQQNDE